MTPATKTWPNYDRSLIGKPFYTIRMLFWPLWPYPQAFEFLVFMMQNRWFLRNCNVALFSYCCSFETSAYLSSSSVTVTQWAMFTKSFTTEQYYHNFSNLIDFARRKMKINNMEAAKIHQKIPQNISIWGGLISSTELNSNNSKRLITMWTFIIRSI